MLKLSLKWFVLSVLIGGVVILSIPNKSYAWWNYIAYMQACARTLDYCKNGDVNDPGTANACIAYLQYCPSAQ